MQDAKFLARKGGAKPWIWVVLILAILLVAWIDGGEEPLRPITQAVPLSGDYR